MSSPTLFALSCFVGRAEWARAGRLSRAKKHSMYWRASMGDWSYEGSVRPAAGRAGDWPDGTGESQTPKASRCGRSETNGRLACIIGKTGCSPLSRIPRDYTASQASTAQHCTTECVRGPLAPSPFKTERARQLVGWTGGLRSPSQDAGDSIEAAGHVQDYSNRGWITKESCSPSASQRLPVISAQQTPRFCFIINKKVETNNIRKHDGPAPIASPPPATNYSTCTRHPSPVSHRLDRSRKSIPDVGISGSPPLFRLTRAPSRPQSTQVPWYPAQALCLHQIQPKTWTPTDRAHRQPK